jgi:hypothetical protein
MGVRCYLRAPRLLSPTQPGKTIERDNVSSAYGMTVAISSNHPRNTGFVGMTIITIRR